MSYINLKQTYDEIISRITNSSSEWKDFLRFSAGIYKYGFDSAALIYAQRPDATMLADIDTWNKRVGRYVNKGAKSIKIFAADVNEAVSSQYPKAQYLFDIKDTNGDPVTIPRLWKLTEATSSLMAERLNKNYGMLAKNLDEALENMAEEMLELVFEHLIEDFEAEIKDTVLSELPYTGVEDCFRKTIIDSIRYLTGCRCNISPENLSQYEFPTISYYNTKELTIKLGNAVSEISKEILREVENTVKQIIREQRSVEENERTAGNGIHRERWDTVPQPANIQQPGSRQETAGQIRTHGNVLLEGEPPKQIQLSADGGRVTSGDAQGERGSLQDAGGNNDKDAQNRPDTRSEQHDGSLQSQDENQGYSRRNSIERDSIQKEITVESSKTAEPQISGSFFTPEQQSIFDTLENNHIQNTEIPDESENDKPEPNNSEDVLEFGRVNYRYSADDEIGVGGQKTKYKANVEAIKTLKVIENENRLADGEEQRILARYVGWGGIPQVFDPDANGWEKEYLELKEILTPEEYESARASTPNAHYTSHAIIEAIYKALDRFGFKDGNLLEPAMGVGNFFSMLPEKMHESKLYGVELDSISGRISRQLYQKADIRIQGFETVDFPDNFFDAAISNVPFGDYKLHDNRYDKYNLHIHDYFFCKALDKVRPGGIIAFVTSKGTLDKENCSVRRYIAQRADLIGAIRLPNTTFLKNAGTEVTTDIIFLQKRERISVEEPEWIHLGLPLKLLIKFVVL